MESALLEGCSSTAGSTGVALAWLFLFIQLKHVQPLLQTKFLINSPVLGVIKNRPLDNFQILGGRRKRFYQMIDIS